MTILCLLLFCNTYSQTDSDKYLPLFGEANYTKLKPRLIELNKDINSRGISFSDKHQTKLLTGYDYNQYYDWDLYFENIYLSYYGISEFNFTNLKVFFSLQKQDGFIQRAFGAKSWGSKQMFKPFIAQIVLLGSHQVGNFQFAKEHYAQLKLYLKRWFEYDTDKNGLAYWEGGADQSGMDNQTSRCVGRSEGVDLNCYLYRELETMAVISRTLGYTEDCKEFQKHARELKGLINKYLWDEKSGFYYDRNEIDGKISYVKSVSGFTPLWAHIASKKQAECLVKQHLINPNEFWLKYPVSGYAKTEPDYYQGSKKGECNWKGSTWIPTNYMICHGLMDYGYKTLAETLASKTFELAINNPTTREYYNAETGEGVGLNPFYGWSSLAYFLPIEVKLNYSPTDLKCKNIQKLSKEINLEFIPSFHK